MKLLFLILTSTGVLAQSPLALSLGSIQGAYEVYVNRIRAGATNSLDSLADMHIPRPMTFDLPSGVLRLEGAQLIALRVRSALFFHPRWRLRDQGPYLLTDAASAPRTAGRQQLEGQWLATSPQLLFGVVFAIIGSLSLLAWLGERERWDLWWFGWVCLAEAFAGEISWKSAREIVEAAKAWGQNDDITVVTVQSTKPVGSAA